MKLFYVFVSTLLLWITGCQNAPENTGDQVPESVAGISLIWEDLPEDSTDIPRTVLMLEENGGAIVLDTLRLSLQKIEKEEYKRMAIPSHAVDACGGWYAGGGDYFYVIKRDGNAVVFRGYTDEEQTDKGYHWKEISLE